MFQLTSVTVFAALVLSGAYNTFFWADAPHIALGRLDSGSGYRDRTLAVSRWVRGSGPDRVQLRGCWIRPDIVAGDIVVYGRSVADGQFQCDTARSAASMSEDMYVVKALQTAPNLVRGQFVVNKRPDWDWHNTTVQLNGPRKSSVLILGSNGAFEIRGLPGGVYRVSLPLPPGTRSTPTSALYIDVPERGCSDRVFQFERVTLMDTVVETFGSASSYLRAVGTVMAETLRLGNRR
jgi:hypothetical protein